MFTHPFEKEENAPPVSKLCLLVISKNRKKAFRDLKIVIHLSSKMIRISRGKRIVLQKESAFNMQKIYIYGFWEIIIKPLTTEKEDMIERGGV